MILSTLVLLSSASLSATTPRASITSSPAERQVPVSGEISEPAITARSNSAKPDAPTPKLIFPANAESDLSAEPAESSSNPAPIINVAVKPATPESYATSRRKRIWYGLMVADHGAAAFDAWTTRHALSGGYGIEGDPLQRPFANSNAIYATTQVVPALMDFMAYRMMRSEHPTIRKFWWLPQAASAGVSLGAGIHNYRIVH